MKALRRIYRLIRGVPAGVRHRGRHRAWLAAHARAGSSVHPSVEVFGVEQWRPFVEIGPGCIVERDVSVWISPDEGANPRLAIGPRAFVGRHTYIGVFQPVTIGRDSLIGAYSYIISANHRYDVRSRPIRDQGFAGRPVTIGPDVWIGTHVVVLPGVSVGRGAVIAAGSVVNRDIPEYEIWGGVPARFLKNRPGGAEGP